MSVYTMSFSVVLLASVLWPAAPVHAWGILLSRDGTPVEMTEVNALFLVWEDSTTVHLKTHFDGSSEDFIWLVPVPSTSRIELSHNDIFTRLDEETRPRYGVLLDVEGETLSEEQIKEWYGFVPDLPELPFENERNEACFNMASQWFFPIADSFGCTGCPTVTLADVRERETRSATIIKAQSPSEIAAWVADRGYETDRLNEAILQSYLEEDHAILAVEVTVPAHLTSLSSSINELQPISVTYAGDAISAPLQLAASAESISGKLTVWIAAEHRAIPENYLHVHLNQARLSWPDVYGLFGWGPSNYDEILSEAIAEAGHHAFSTEYAAERAARADRAESSIDLESLRNPENLGAFMGDLRRKGIHSRGQLDLKLLQLLRQHVPIPDAVLEEIKREDIDPLTPLGWDFWNVYSHAEEFQTAVFHPYAESQFYSYPNRYEDFYENERFDFSGFVDDWVTYVHAPKTKVQQALAARPYLTRLTTFVFPDQTKMDPVFNFNPDLGPVSLYNLGRLGFECRGSENEGYDISDLIAVVGLEGGQILRYGRYGFSWDEISLYEDSEIPPAAAHRIEQLNTSGPPVVLSHETAVLDTYTEEQPVAVGLTLAANRPNPFNSSTSVSYTIPIGTMRVALQVYNVLGQSVRTLVAQSAPEAGSHTIRWDGQTDAKAPVTSGLYLLALQADDQLLTRKIMLIR